MVEERREPLAEYERERARLIRRATRYAVGFFGAAVVVAVGGAALIAGVLSRFGLPFRATWLVIASVVLLVPLAGAGVRWLRRRGDRRRRGRDAGEREDVGK